MRATRVLHENCLSPRCSLRIDRAPAGEAGGQDLKRHQERCDPHEAFAGFFRASSGRGFPEEVPKLPMGFNEGSELGFPQYVWQAGMAVQFVVALDQATALRGQAVRQEAEVRALSLVDTSHMACVVRTLCHDTHRSAPRALVLPMDAGRKNVYRPTIAVKAWVCKVLVIEGDTCRGIQLPTVIGLQDLLGPRVRQLSVSDK